MIKQIIFYILFYTYKIWKIIFYIDKNFLDIIANPSSYQLSMMTAKGSYCTKFSIVLNVEFIKHHGMWYTKLLYMNMPQY